MFKTTFKEEGKNYVMAFEGRLDTPASVQAGRDMQVLNNCEGHDITLDCTALEYISSSGMRLFLDLLKTTREKGSQLILVGLHEDIRMVFDEVGFLNLFDIR
jgi:anti-sigma B factor antagonist